MKSKFEFIKLRHNDEEDFKFDRYDRMTVVKFQLKQRWVYHNLKIQTCVITVKPNCDPNPKFEAPLK